MDNYLPKIDYLIKYANLLVNFCLNNGRGIQKGECALVIGLEINRPLYVEVCKAIWRSGGHVIHDFRPNGINVAMLESSELESLSFYPKAMQDGRVEAMNHIIHISGPSKMRAFQGIDQNKIAALAEANNYINSLLGKKSNEGKLSGTMCLYPTPAMAAEVGMDYEDYWQEVIKALFLDKPDPIAEWKKVRAQIAAQRDKLNALEIKQLVVSLDGCELKLDIGADRQWIMSEGSNMPSFELYITPDWRGTKGTIRFNEPVYWRGDVIKNAELTFKDGVVTSFNAQEGRHLLEKIISYENGDKIGEFSLTQGGISPITKLMGSTLFDENRGGPNGNMHIALGGSYRESFRGSVKPQSDEEWFKLGFNFCKMVHVDIVNTEPKKIEAILTDGRVLIIYENGKFTL